MKFHSAAVILLCVTATPAQESADVDIDQLLSQDEQAAIGYSEMTDSAQLALRTALVTKFMAGYEVGWKESATEVQTKKQLQSAAAPQVVESQIDGDFEGWEGETVVKLMNGQIWQQTEYYYHYHYAFMPEVLVYRSGEY